MITRPDSGEARIEYLLKDRLGSVDAIADSLGRITETRGYDAFGAPRLGDWADSPTRRIESTETTPRGFTAHEHLNAVAVIHMNGRAYDYQLGRFLSVDPFIQFPEDSQTLAQRLATGVCDKPRSLVVKEREGRNRFWTPPSETACRRA